MSDESYERMKRNNHEADDIAVLVPHQANKRIIDATANRMGLSQEKVMMNIERYGNTTAATIPSACGTIASSSTKATTSYWPPSEAGLPGAPPG